MDAMFTAEMVKLMLGSRSVQEFNTVSNSEIVLLLDSEEEAMRLLTVGSFSKGGLTYAIRRWKPIGAREELEWMQKKERIIEVLGSKIISAKQKSSNLVFWFSG